MTEPDLIGTREACRILACGKTSLYRMEAAGKIESVVYIEGGNKRWRRADILALTGGKPEPEKPQSEAEKRRAARRALRKSA